MQSEPNVDPSRQQLRPTHEEIEAWAVREHARRATWLAGPTAEEKQDWARRYRWRAALGLAETRLAPTPEDVDRWAERERKRRDAWVEGPSETEKQSWAAEQHYRAGADPADSTPPAEAEVEAWAAREKQRRRDWLAGPSEEEKQHWAERRTTGLLDDLMSLPAALEFELPEGARYFLREAELVGKGAMYSLARAPLAVWSYLIRAGRTFEEEFYQQPRRRRVRY
jgi:hypothetical protein